jgi:hypothetical protein
MSFLTRSEEIDLLVEESLDGWVSSNVASLDKVGDLLNEKLSVNSRRKVRDGNHAVRGWGDVRRQWQWHWCWFWKRRKAEFWSLSSINWRGSSLGGDWNWLWSLSSINWRGSSLGGDWNWLWSKAGGVNISWGDWATVGDVELNDLDAGDPLGEGFRLVLLSLLACKEGRKALFLSSDPDGQLSISGVKSVTNSLGESGGFGISRFLGVSWDSSEGFNDFDDDLSLGGGGVVSVNWHLSFLFV